MWSINWYTEADTWFWEIMLGFVDEPCGPGNERCDYCLNSGRFESTQADIFFNKLCSLMLPRTRLTSFLILVWYVSCISCILSQWVSYCWSSVSCWLYDSHLFTLWYLLLVKNPCESDALCRHKIKYQSKIFYLSPLRFGCDLRDYNIAPDGNSL